MPDSSYPQDQMDEICDFLQTKLKKPATAKQLPDTSGL